MRPILLATAWACITFGLAGAFAWCITSGLTDATRADCERGIGNACEQLVRDGVKP